MRNRNDDLTSRWAFNPRNPRGPMPDSKQAVSYADKDAREYYLLDLYGRQDRPQPQPKKRPQ